MNMKSYLKILLVTLILASCGQKEQEPFWLGADLGWITEYESWGHKFYNKDGQEMECTALMKELGLNAVRHRVWVDPSKYGNWCSKEDLLVTRGVSNIEPSCPNPPINSNLKHWLNSYTQIGNSLANIISQKAETS